MPYYREEDDEREDYGFVEPPPPDPAEVPTPTTPPTPSTAEPPQSDQGPVTPPTLAPPSDDDANILDDKPIIPDEGEYDGGNEEYGFGGEPEGTTTEQGVQVIEDAINRMRGRGTRAIESHYASRGLTGSTGAGMEGEGMRDFEMELQRLHRERLFGLQRERSSVRNDQMQILFQYASQFPEVMAKLGPDFWESLLNQGPREPETAYAPDPGEIDKTGYGF